MNASKEECKRAIDALGQWRESSAAKTLVFEFLQSALRRLPSEESIEKDRRRKKAAQ